MPLMLHVLSCAALSHSSSTHLLSPSHTEFSIAHSGLLTTDSYATLELLALLLAMVQAPLLATLGPQADHVSSHFVP